jgi:hypothetical protein
MSVLHDWQCLAHGVFEKRVQPGRIPKCPKGCSSSFVKLVYLKPVGTVSARTRKSDKLVREMADAQGLSDISTSPSRPGGSVAQRNRMKNGMRGPQGREYPDFAAAQPAQLSKFLGAMTHKANELSNAGFGHKYDPSEWKKDDKSGAVRHVGAHGPIAPLPVGSTGVSVERVREKP